MPFGLRDEDFKKIETVLRSYPKIQDAIIFGSRAKGTYRHGSDIDIALKGSIDQRLINDLLQAMDELFLPYTFDLVDYASIDNQEFREHIDRVGMSLINKDTFQDLK